MDVAQSRGLEQDCVCNDGRERRDRAPVTNIKENLAIGKKLSEEK